MRQSNGSELFGAKDPRSTTIGIIDVAPEDDRASILAAILTQDKLGRKQTALVMPEGNKAFRRAVDFEGFKNTLDGLQTQLVFITNKETQLTKFARQHQLLVFRSLENYAGYVKTFLKQDAVGTDVSRPPAAPSLPTLDAGAAGGRDTSVPTDAQIPPRGRRDTSVPTETQTPPQVQPPPEMPAPVAVEREMPQWILPSSPAIAREDEVTRPLTPTTSPPPPSPTQEESVTPGAERQVKDQRAKDQREQVKTGNGSNEAQAAPASTAPAHSMPPAGPQPIILTPADEEPEPLDKEPKAVLVPPPPRPHTLLPVPPSQLRPVRSGSGSLRLIAALLLLILLLLGGAYLSVLAGIGPLGQFFPGSAATVTITAGSKDLKQTYTLSAITGAPDASKKQVAARFLSVTTPEQSKTEPVSGIGTTPATLASGMLTFYNALSQAQTVAAGTVFTDSRGIQIVSDQAIEIPAATPPLEGSAAVSAHAVMVGTKGNIAALDFQTLVCCHAGITVTNTQAFSGGQDQQTYTYVEQRDIDTIADTLFIPLQASGQQAVQKQLLPNEQFVGTTKCNRNVSANPPAGDQTTNVTVSETVTCVAEAFDQQGAQSLATGLLKADAMKNPGASYALLGHIATTMTASQPQDAQGTVLLHVTAQGRWGAQFDDARKQQLAHKIAGQSAGAAQDLLLRQVGVSQASIAVSGSIGNVLPTDARRITIITK